MVSPGATNPALLLGQRLREMQECIEQLREAERQAIEARHKADVAEWRAFLAADGAEYRRRYTARLECEHLIREAEDAEALVRHLQRELKLRDKRVDVGRTYSADLRAELKTLGMTEETAT